MLKWTRVTKRNRCPICSEDTWCMIAPDKSAVICMRHANDHEHKMKDGITGWIHRMDGKAAPPPPREFVPEYSDEVRMDWDAILKRYCIGTLTSHREELCEKLGCTGLAIVAIGAFWSERHRAWAFPMYRTAGDGFAEVCGIRFRDLAGHKWALKGSHQGVFLPIPQIPSEYLLICEGPTDTMAAFDLGFAAVGRPSCSGSLDVLRAYCKAFKGEVVIVADNDLPGLVGAAELALGIGRMCRIIKPVKAKDIREWKKNGSTHDTVLSVIRGNGYVNHDQLRKNIREWRKAMEARTARKESAPATDSGCRCTTKACCTAGGESAAR